MKYPMLRWLLPELHFEQKVSLELKYPEYVGDLKNIKNSPFAARIATYNLKVKELFCKMQWRARIFTDTNSPDQ